MRNVLAIHVAYCENVLTREFPRQIIRQKQLACSQLD